MNRLTQKSARADGYHYFPECFERCNGIPGNCGECDVTQKVCEALAAYEDTGLTPEQIIAMKNASTFNQLNLYSPAFAEAEEILNKELNEALSILKKSPMFEGRVTVPIVISDRGNTVRPIPYKTKYSPIISTPEEHSNNLPGQLTFDR